VIHAIPHTHLDAGWLEPMDSLFNKYVKDIFASVMSELETNQSYRFNWAEVGYLKLWWA